MTPTVTIIYVNYHCESLISRSIRALLASPIRAGLEILVVDNGASQEAAFWADLPVRHLSSGGNLGFGKACNHGASQSEADYLLFLNPDTIPGPGLVDALVGHLDSHPEASACGPALMDEEGNPIVYWVYHRLLSWELAESLYLQGIWRRFLQARMRRRFGTQEPWPVAVLSGACLFLSRRRFEEIGGFDERFFLNFEDIEICHRLESKGPLHFLPSVELIHEEGSIQRANWASFVYHRLDAHRTYIDIVHRGWRWWVARAILVQTVCLRLLAGGVFLHGAGRTRLPGYWKALRSTFRQRTP